MGDNIINFYAGQPPLNRVAFQRHSSEIMNRHLHDPETRFLIFKDGRPLMKKDDSGRILYLTKDQLGVERLGQEFGVAPSDASSDSKKLYETSRLPHTQPALVFLGVDDRGSPTTNSSSKVDHLNPQGPAYFALDAHSHSEEWDSLLQKQNGEWGDARSSGNSMSDWDAGVYAQGRALVDWNVRNKFCPACGSPTYSLWAGWKRNCTSSVQPAEGKEPCFSTKGLHNFAYPRTDPVIIMGILDSTGEKMLLGRQKSWPKGMYSCLAGFIEPGETFEDATRREVLEEAGIEVGPVRYSSSQPWPFPSNLMVGTFGRAKDGQTIRLDLDNELEDAQWFPKSLIQRIISSPTGSTFSQKDYKQLEQKSQTHHDQETSAALAPSEKKPDELVAKDVELGISRVPPRTAIAGTLIRQWCDGGLDLVSKL
ncbi:NAD+ diphosphatase [Kwoniella mangroviensis CBS 8886]|nr:NAD+ diphosphatase [Kwoniella mangroviensis CBS 8886]